jgi:hypothetical protein
VLLFQPTAAEVHQRAGTWFDDEEIYGWFAKNLHRVREPSLRHYGRAKELKAADAVHEPERQAFQWERAEHERLRAGMGQETARLEAELSRVEAEGRLARADGLHP